ncbi:hypothetical protein DEJ17_15935 [Curtobacterium sp. MCSS17_011]|nr:hypothetical protein DEJ17_15935 [Curtobacterium sp. MCSS17_011]
MKPSQLYETSRLSGMDATGGSHRPSANPMQLWKNRIPAKARLTSGDGPPGVPQVARLMSAIATSWSTRPAAKGVQR